MENQLREIHAIYEQGILRPAEPLDLPDGSHVQLRLQSVNGHALDTLEVSVADQQAALDEMFREVDAIPQTSRSDGLTGRDHDTILYGLRR